MFDRVTQQNKPKKRLLLQFSNNNQNKKECLLLLRNKIYSICSCFPNLLDDSWAGEIWELLASSSHSSDGCRFVDVKESPISGSWSAVIDMDCWIQQTTTISSCQTWSWCKCLWKFLIPLDHLYVCALEFWFIYKKQIWYCKQRPILKTYRCMLGRIIGTKHCNFNLWTCLHKILIDTNTIHAKQISIWITYRYNNNWSS